MSLPPSVTLFPARVQRASWVPRWSLLTCMTVFLLPPVPCAREAAFPRRRQAPLALVRSSAMPQTSTRRSVVGWPVEFVTAEGNTTLLVGEDESLLVVAERANLRPPSECRRGNCLSCAAKLLPGSSRNVVTRVRHGTTPPVELGPGAEVDESTFLCEDAKQQGYLLMCSAYIVGPGVILELDMCESASRIQYHDRFLPLRQAGFAASAGVMREWAQDNVGEWISLNDPDVGETQQ